MGHSSDEKINAVVAASPPPIADDSVTYAKIQNVSATDKVLGRATAGAGDIEEIACTAAGRALIDDADATAQRATLGLGTLATQSGTFSGTSSGTNTGDQTITLTGDVTGSGTGSFAATIGDDKVTFAKMQNVSAASRLIGRGSAAGAGDPEEIILGTNLSMSGTTLNATGGGTWAPSIFSIWGTQAGLLGNNQIIYAYIAGSPAITATESLSQVRMPACRIIALSGNNYTHGTNYTLTVRKNGAATAMTTGLVTTIQNHFRITTGGPITFADGDLLALEMNMATGGPGSGFRGLRLEIQMAVA